MTTAVIAALAALSGVLLGKILDAKSKSTEWLRGHRSQAYAAFIGATERYLSGVLVARGAKDFRSSDQGKELDRIYGDLQVFGSEDVHVAAEEVRKQLFRLHSIKFDDGQVTDVEGFPEATTEVIGCIRRAMGQLREIMKAELRVK